MSSVWRECGHEVSGTEQECLHCRIAELEGLLREHLHPPPEIDAFQWHDEYLNRCRKALNSGVGDE